MYLTRDNPRAALVRRFHDDRSGAIAIIFALVLVPILLIIGLAIDYGHATTFQSSVQKTLDEAAVAGASELAKSGDPRRATVIAERRFAATRPKAYAVNVNFSADPRRRTVTADAEAKVPMSFMGLAGFNTMPIAAHAVAAVKQPKLKKQQRAALSKMQRIVSKLSASDISDLIYRVETMCEQLRRMGFAGRVPQCRAVYNGTFEKQLRAELAAGTSINKLVPGGIRLVQ